MDAPDLDRIEARLAVSLPAEYRAFLEHYPPDLRRLSEYEIADDAGFVIEETIRHRLTASRGARRSYDCVVIGHSGCGDYYCLDLGQAPPPVVCLDHETGEVEHSASSFGAFVRKLQRGPSAA